MANSADSTSMIFFLLVFLENRIWYFMQIVFIGDNLHEMSKPVFWEKKKKKKFQYIVCWKFYTESLVLKQGSFWRSIDMFHHHSSISTWHI